MLKRLLVGVLILAAAVLTALVSYSYLTSTFFSQRRWVLREGNGIFWEAELEPLGEEMAPDLGFPALDFTLPDLNGQFISLSQLRGKPVLLNFWAGWCPPCRKEMLDLQRFHEQYQDQVVVLGINWAEEPQTIRAFLERYKITYTNLLDRQGKAFVAYRLTGVPTTFFLDESGVIRGMWLGPLKTDEIAEDFAKITSAFQPQR